MAGVDGEAPDVCCVEWITPYKAWVRAPPSFVGSKAHLNAVCEELRNFSDVTLAATSQDYERLHIVIETRREYQDVLQLIGEAAAIAAHRMTLALEAVR